MRLDFGLLPKVPDVHSLNPEELRKNLPGAFEDEPVYERPPLMTDGVGNIGKGVKKMAPFLNGTLVCATSLTQQ